MAGNQRFARRAERVVRRVADRLGSPRDQAFVHFAEAGYALITGGKTYSDGISQHKEPRIDGAALRRAEDAFDAGDYEIALDRIEEIIRAHPDSVRALRVRRDIESKQGALTAAARTLHRIHELEGLGESRGERMLLGRISRDA